MAFFNQMAPGGMGGAGGSPSAFTSPGINPMTLAMLLRMQGMGGAQGAPGGGSPLMMGGPAGAPGVAGPPGGGGVPQVGAPQMPPPVTMNAGMRPGMPGGGMPAGASAGPTGANPMLAQLMANPAMAQHLMQMLGMGGGGAATGMPANLLPGMGAGAAPAGGTGGMY